MLYMNIVSINSEKNNDIVSNSFISDMIEHHNLEKDIDSPISIEKNDVTEVGSALENIDLVKVNNDLNTKIEEMIAGSYS